MLIRWVDAIAALGSKGIALCAICGRAGIMLARALFGKQSICKQFSLVTREFYNVGVQSFSIIVVSGLFIGMVLSVQGYSVLEQYGAQGTLGQLVLLSLLRELGPVITALLFAGRSGSAITAEIGLMQATEQVASLEIMAVDPLQRIIAPRFWASCIALPLLTLLFITVGIFSGSQVGIEWKAIDAGIFWGTIQSTIDLKHELIISLSKSLTFAVVTSTIALFNGYYCRPSSAGISKATTQTVVYASLGILGLDFILTVFIFGSG